VAIDRHLAILTWFDPATCAPLRQLDVSTGFVSNPQDIASASPTKAYVSRLERNAAPTPDPGDHDEGDDLLIIDPSIPAITGRIDLSSYAVAVPGKAIQARPTATRIIGGTLYVALDSANEDFSSFGHGRVVAIDTATDQVTGAIDIAEFKNCTGLSLHPAFESLDVACGGAFSDLDQQVAGSGISFVDVLAAPPAETHHQSAAVFGGLPLAGFSGIALDRALGFGVTAGDFMTTGDQLWTYDATAGTAAMLTQTADSFVFGNPVLDPSRDLVYMTDATAGHAQIQVFSFANGTGPVAAPAILAADPALPPRSIAWY
jgi:hypothetical protein